MLQRAVARNPGYVPGSLWQDYSETGPKNVKNRLQSVYLPGNRRRMFTRLPSKAGCSILREASAVRGSVARAGTIIPR